MNIKKSKFWKRIMKSQPRVKIFALTKKDKENEKFMNEYLKWLSK